MDKKVKPRDSGGWLTWIGGSTVIAAIVITAGVSWLLYEHTVSLLTDNLRQRLLSIGITQAANIDYRDIEALRTEEDWQKPEWTRVVSQMKRAKESNSDIVFMYIFRKTKNDPTQMEFVADAGSLNPYVNIDEDPGNNVDANGDGIIEPEGADKLQWPGQPYPEASEIPETFEAYAGPMTARDLYEDSYGEVLTGYAPIKDENGSTIAVLATDIKAGDFFTVTRQTLYPFLLFIVFLILAITILALVLIKIWNKRVELFAELDRQKDELLGMVTHQLQTPVTAVKWYIEGFLTGDEGKVSSSQRLRLLEIQGVVFSLIELINMILDISRIQLGKVRIDTQELDLGGLFYEILEVIEPKAKLKKVDLQVSIPKSLPTVMLDKRYTRMTVENLLSNAIKYTPESGKVVWKIEIRDTMLCCEVTDNGCGIPRKDQDKIFGKLFRASNVSNSPIEGNGFGLYVAKGAVEAQGGRIWFKSEENKGTSFFIELPLKIASKKDAA